MISWSKITVSGNMLKWIAAISMVIDHVGVMFFPSCEVFRVIGRLAFPIFSFMIAEGCRYTRNKPRYFLTIFILALGCQTVYYLFARSVYMCVLVTFSLSILVIYAMQYAKDTCFSAAVFGKKVGSVLLLGAAIAVVWWINTRLSVGYGFWGCMLPAFGAMLQPPRRNAPEVWSSLDTIPNRVLFLSVGLGVLAMIYEKVQIYALLAIPLLMLYSGERGKRKMKYFFYIFYPAHLALLEGLKMLLS